MRTIYLDYNATTPLAPSVLEAMEPFFVRRYGNPSSGHALGRACQEAVEDARGHVASLLAAAIDEIIFLRVVDIEGRAIKRPVSVTKRAASNDRTRVRERRPK